MEEREVATMRPFFTYPRVTMPVEIEAKMKLDDASALASCILERGGSAVGIYLETHTFYDTEDRSLLAADEGLRLRVSRDLTSGVIKTSLTHKGPNRHSSLKVRPETEMAVNSAAEASRLLDCLGYSQCLKFQKKRQTWKLEGCKVEIDEVPHLGAFVEIEGPTEASVMHVREMLGLADRPLIKASYVAMLTSYLQENSQTATEILFPNPEPPTVARAG